MIKNALILIVVLLLGINAQLPGQGPPKAKNGRLDLTGWNFSRNGSLLLQGEWDFYWKDFRNSPAENSAKVTAEVPGLWNNISATNGSSFGYATYELQILLPANHPRMAVSIPGMYSAYEFEINGRVFSNDGKIARDKESYTPLRNTYTKALPTNSDTLNIKIRIANFDHHKGGMGQAIRLGDYELFQDRVLYVSLDIFLAGSLVMGGLFFLGLYMFGNQSKPILYFSLFCIVWGYRIVASGIYASHPLIPMPWEIRLRLEYISMFLAALFFTRYVYCLYKREFYRIVEKILILAFGTLAIIALFFPPYIFTQTVFIFFCVVVPGLLVALLIIIKSTVKTKNTSIYGIASILVIISVFVYFFLSYFGLFERSVVFTFFGSITFVFLQSLVLSFRYSRELKDAKEIAEQASNAKTEFLSTMSHEIRTPLNAVIGLSNFLIEENPRNDQKESLDNLKFASENLLSLINDILDYNKIDAGKIDFEEKPFNIRRLLDGTIAAYSHIAEEKGIELSHSVDQHVPNVVVGDITRLSQVLTNLIGNAIKFTKKGYVEVSLSFVARSNEKVAIKFSVQDTGVGIAEEKQNLIFESFTQASSATTREFGGSGLGLSITDKLLGLMGSKLFLKSTVGVGSRFYFTQFFEVAEIDQEKPVEHATQKNISLEGQKVLIVEDTVVNIMVAQKFLEKWGLIVDSAENGAIAVEKIKTNSYDIILMDLQMPVMDGYQATIAIRQQGIQIPIIALTAAAVTEVIEKINDVGMNAYVTKPFNPMVLRDKMKEMLIDD
ncbi:MAG: response regulator [Bacteroidota bacterium]